jgi:hypothetical protein
VLNAAEKTNKEKNSKRARYWRLFNDEKNTKHWAMYKYVISSGVSAPRP